MEEFRIRHRAFGAFVAPFVLPLLLFLPVTTALGGILTGDGGLGLLIGIIATAALTGVLVSRYRRMVRGTVVRFSAEGVEMADTYGFLLRLPWAGIERVDVVESRMASPRRVGRPGGVQVRAGAMRSVGLVGWGEREVPLRVPGWMRAHLARVPVDPDTGLQWLGIPLGVVDPAWENGRMGEWVRHHRPDLLAS
ncbi:MULTISPECIES: hypothetical protein [Nonomuraea]|uniref:PH domain-containing protein n=1 Tax=Nonomuraea ferruginea TaxID=46174 RepID=A0ABT4T1Y6_9ACTN|nr:hypothetical protein [Nonomuraea ferruginea]MDA0643061.1 hypothetical protein [Nonomuraea ferruginea]